MQVLRAPPLQRTTKIDVAPLDLDVDGPSAFVV